MTNRSIIVSAIALTLAFTLSCGQNREVTRRIDLNGDGKDEVLIFTGNIADGDARLEVYKEGKGGKLQMVGRMSCSYPDDFFVTDDGRIVCLCGSQGDADIAVMRGDTLERVGDYIDKALFSSKAFHNLEYDYDDDSEQCHKFPPLLKADKYIICNHETIGGDHVLKIDLDGDGQQEQLYLGNPGWGAISYDLARVNTRTKAFPIVPFMENDTIAFAPTELDFERYAYFRDFIQLSALDLDGDGTYEVIASAGTTQSNSHYIFSFSPSKGLTLLRHFYHSGIVVDLKKDK